MPRLGQFVNSFGSSRHLSARRSVADSVLRPVPLAKGKTRSSLEGRNASGAQQRSRSHIAEPLLSGFGAVRQWRSSAPRQLPPRNGRHRSSRALRRCPDLTAEVDPRSLGTAR